MSDVDGGPPAPDPDLAPCPAPVPMALSAAAAGPAAESQAAAASSRMTPRQALLTRTRRRYFASMCIDKPTVDQERHFQYIVAAALAVPAATREGQFLGDDLCKVFTRNGENFIFPVYPKSKIEEE